MPWPVDPPLTKPAPRVSRLAARVPADQRPKRQLSTGLPDNLARYILLTMHGENTARQIVDTYQNPPQPAPEEPPA